MAKHLATETAPATFVATRTTPARHRVAIVKGDRIITNFGSSPVNHVDVINGTEYVAIDSATPGFEQYIPMSEVIPA